MIHSYETQLGARGRIVLPADLRSRHGWQEGERLRLVEEEDGTVRLLSAEEALDRVMGMYAHLVPPGVSVVDELIAERRAEAAAE
jgi:AbrB family looped-hinge helix DNA binding protein